MTPQYIRIHHTHPRSSVNGPGVRSVVWVQGCSLHCKGCFNPDTHEPDQGGTLYVAHELGEQMAQIGAEGMTISGGEPLDQPEALADMIRSYRAHHHGTVLLYTGYTIEAILRSPVRQAALLECDAALAGPYRPGENGIWQDKRLVLLTDRIQAQQIQPEASIEFTLDHQQQLQITGYPPVDIRSRL